MRHIKYSGNAAYTDNFFGSGKTWLRNGHIHEVADVVADKLLTNAPVVTGATLRVLVIGA